MRRGLNRSSLSSNVVENESEHVVLDEEGITRGLEDKVLHKGLRRVIISTSHQAT